MEEKRLTCIVCPRGCGLSVSPTGTVKGNYCPRGVIYGRQEAIDPRRVLTSSVAVAKGAAPLVSVRTSEPIPLAKMNEAMAAIKKMKVAAPVKFHQVLVEDFLGLGINLIAGNPVKEL